MSILNSNLSSNIQSLLVKNSSGSLKALADVAKDKRAAKEGSTLGTAVGVLKGGFTSLTAAVNETIGKTDEPIVSILGDDVPGIIVKKTSTLASELSTLTGKSMSDGLLNAVIASGNPNGLKETLVNVLGATLTQANAALKEVSAEPTLIEDAIEEDIGNTLTTDAEKISKKTMQNLKNPLGATQSFGSLGLPFGNILGAVTGNILDKVPQQSLGEVVSSLPINAAIPEVLPPNIVDADGSTNLRSVIAEDIPLPANVKNSKPPLVIGNDESIFTYPTPANYQFKEIGGYEELEKELRSASRDITTAVIRWSETYTNQNYTAEDLHKEHVRQQTAAVSLASLLAEAEIGNQIAGITYHYVIRRDGVIQRGRPLNLRTKTNDANLANHSVHVGFIAGWDGDLHDPSARLSENSILPAQWRAFDAFLESFYKAVPGAAVYGFNEIVDTGARSPGFDVSTYISSKYKKKNVSVTRVSSSEEIATTVPTYVESPSRTVAKEETFFKVPEIESTITTPVSERSGEPLPPTDNQLVQVLTARAVALEQNFRNKKELLQKENDIGQLTRNVSNELQTELTTLKTKLAGSEEDLFKLRKDLADNGYKYSEQLKDWVK